MYYIERPYTWRAANKKCAEIQEYVGQYNHCIVADEIALAALVEEIRHKIEELNASYPRSKELALSYENDGHISCYPLPKISDSDYVFTMYFKPVLRHYRFAEKTGILEEGDEQ